MTTNLGQYKSSIKKTFANLKYVNDNSPSVYGTKKLDNRETAAYYGQRASVAGYNSEKTGVFNQKLSNLDSLLRDEKRLVTSDLKILNNETGEILKDFNTNIDKLNRIDREITTKDKIIQFNQYTYEKKIMAVSAMKSVILYLALMIVPLILILMGVVGKMYGFLFIGLCGIITLIVILVRLSKMRQPQLENISKKTKETAKDFTKDLLKDILPKTFLKPCPSRCKPQGSEEEPPEPSYDYVKGNEVWVDNSQNRWKKGDIPTIGANEEGYEALGEEVEPMRFYGKAAETKQYRCKWKYDPSKMTNMDKGVEFVTTIPCEYYPGYETVKSDLPPVPNTPNCRDGNSCEFANNQYLFGCGKGMNDNYVCKNAVTKEERTNNNLPDWAACPYQCKMENGKCIGNFRWNSNFDKDGNAMNCSPPPNGTKGYQQEVTYSPEFYLQSKTVY